MYDSIEALFGKKPALTSYKIAPPLKGGGQRRVLGPSNVPRMPNNAYPTGLVIKKLLFILTGRDIRRFRLKFLVDIFRILIVVSSPALLLWPWAISRHVVRGIVHRYG